MRRSGEAMEEQNRVNEKKDRNTQRQEKEVVTGREKVGENTRRDCHQTKTKITVEKNIKT